MLTVKAPALISLYTYLCPTAQMFGPRNNGYASGMYPQSTNQFYPNNPYAFQKARNAFAQEVPFGNGAFVLARSQSESALFGRSPGKKQEGQGSFYQKPAPGNLQQNISSAINKNDANFSQTFKPEPVQEEKQEENQEAKNDPNSIPKPSPVQPSASEHLKNPFNQINRGIEASFGSQISPININQNVPSVLHGSNSERQQFSNHFGSNPQNIQEREKREEEEQVEKDHEPHCKYCPRKYNLSKMACEECVSVKRDELSKKFKEKVAQFQAKSKVDLDEIKRLKKQIGMLEKEGKERQVQHERDINNLKTKNENEEGKNDELLERITMLNDVVRVNENFKEDSRLVTEENQEGWRRIYRWAEKFSLFINRLAETVPQKSDEVNKILIKKEEDIVFNLQEKLSNIPKGLISILDQVEEGKKVELSCMEEARQQVSSVLDGQKKAFEDSKVPFPEITICLALEPFNSSVRKLEQEISDLEELKSECVLFSIFNVDMCEGSKKHIARSKYPVVKSKKSWEELNQSPAEVIQANEATVEVNPSLQDEKKSE